MVATRSLNIDITNVGAMTSIFPIAYGCSKFVAGVLGEFLVEWGGGVIEMGEVGEGDCVVAWRGGGVGAWVSVEPQLLVLSN